MINLKAVRETGSEPRVHGNGFIQLDLTERSRLHIWGDPRISRQKVTTPIHDHVFGFVSTIIVGRLVNVVYTVEPREHGDFRVYVPEMREGHDTILKPTSMEVIAEPIHVDMVNWNSGGNSYGILAGDFHETFAPDGPAATVITKDDDTQAQGNTALPRVLVPVDRAPDNDFNRHHAMPQSLLWSIIEETLKGRTR